MNKIILKLSCIFYLFVFISNIFSQSFEAIDGKIYIPTNDISTTATYYTFEDVKIFVARKSDGNIISHRDACQACGPAGFVQNGIAMKCNACGLEYEIDNLGVDNPGTCWPFYISNSTENDKLVLDQSELGVDLDNTSVYDQKIYPNSNMKLLNFSNLESTFVIPNEGNYKLAIYNLSGKIIAEINKTYSSGGIYREKFNDKAISRGEYLFSLKSNKGTIISKILID